MEACYFASLLKSYNDKKHLNCYTLYGEIVFQTEPIGC